MPRTVHNKLEAKPALKPFAAVSDRSFGQRQIAQPKVLRHAEVADKHGHSNDIFEPDDGDSDLRTGANL